VKDPMTRQDEIRDRAAEIEARWEELLAMEPMDEAAKDEFVALSYELLAMTREGVETAAMLRAEGMH